MAEEFFYKTDENSAELGPISSTLLKQFAAAGQIRSTMFIRKGTGDWKAASSVKGLSFEATAPPAAAAAPISPTPVAKSAAPVAKATVAPTAQPVTTPDKPVEKGPVAKAPELPTVAPQSKPAAGGLDLGGLKVSPKKGPASKKKKEKKAAAKPAPVAAPIAAPVVAAAAPAATPVAQMEIEPDIMPDAAPAVATPAASKPKSGKKRSGGKSKGGGIIGSLFSFNNFIAPRVIKVVYYLLLVILLLGWLGFTASISIQLSVLMGMPGALIGLAVGAIVGGIITFLYLLTIRVACETVIVIFQINDNIVEMKEELRASKEN
ncbi:MAG: hypothetical protein COA78_24655 [Blastopirellula sp.]|nr:MAG: hypothetical protein COA78_24655 [Blastopirellula sp.]